MAAGPGGADRSPEDDARVSEARLLALRRRLYAPGATPSDRLAYERALSTRPSIPPVSEEAAEPPAVARDSAADPDADALDGDGSASSPKPAPRRPLLLGAAAVVLVAIGATLGAAVSSNADRTVARPGVTSSPQPPPTVRAQRIPRPIAAAAVQMPAAERKREAAALAKSFDTADPSAFYEALGSAGSSFGNSAWMARKGCSESSGTFRAARTGRSSIVNGATVFSLPAGAHVRLSISMTRAVDWSWVISGTQAGATATPVSVGAGGAASGTAQYAEFDARSDVDVTSIRVYTADSTLFAWRIDSCTTG